MPKELDQTRITIISAVHAWNDTRIFFKEAISLAKKNYTVILIGMSDEKNILYRNGIKVYTLKRKRRHIRWVNWIPIIKIVLREKSEMIHFHDPELIFVGMILKLCNKKVIFDIHEDFAKQIGDKEWLPKYIRKVFSKVYKHIEKYLPKIFDKIILAEDSYRHNFSKSNNISIIHNFPRIPSLYKKDYNSSIFKMIYVGDIRIIRGINEYINILEMALRNSLDVQLLIVGSFAEKNLELQVKEVIKEKGLVNNIKLFGRIPNEEIYSILMNCEIGLALLHPVQNYLNSYPTKIFEYMSVGLPVLASNFKLWKNIILENECGKCVNPLIINESYEVIRDYYFSEDLRRKHGMNGQIAVRMKYNWGNEEKLLYEAYDNLKLKKNNFLFTVF